MGHASVAFDGVGPQQEDLRDDRGVAQSSDRGRAPLCLSRRHRAQPCRRKAAPHRRHGVVDQEISKHRVAEGPRDERYHHRVSPGRAPLSQPKVRKTLDTTYYRELFQDGTGRVAICEHKLTRIHYRMICITARRQLISLIRSLFEHPKRPASPR